MTKIDLTRALVEATSFPVTKSAHLVDEVLEVIRSTLERGEDVKLSGFGNFWLCRKLFSRTLQLLDGILVARRDSYDQLQRPVV